MENLHKLNLELLHAIVVQENHADHQGLHLHLGIWLKEVFRTRNVHFFDSIVGKHGSYEAIRNSKKTVDYLLKEDQEPLIFGDPISFSKGGNQSKSTAVAEMLLTGSTIDSVMESDPGYFLLHRTKIQDFHSYIMEKRTREQLTPLKLPIVYSSSHSDTKSIVDWLNTNLLVSRRFKQEQLYIYGAPNSFKTSLINLLGKFLRVYYFPIVEDFYCLYNDDNYDLIVYDEFHGQKTIQTLNAWVQGAPTAIRKKGSSYLKVKNLPFIILSNYMLRESYSGAALRDPVKVDSLAARFLQVNLTTPIDLDNIFVNGINWKDQPVDPFDHLTPFDLPQSSPYQMDDLSQLL